MKHPSKNLSHIIRSIEDAVEFDDESEYQKYEQITSSKKQLFDEISLLDKKRNKNKEHRKTEILFDIGS